MISLDAWLFSKDFEQSFPMEVNFVPMLHPTDEGKIFIAEKATFNSLTDFLQTEFYRGLAIGNAPRRCHNCGQYFLLTSGYNICYCNNIAPSETKRTCRKVGARRKEAQGKATRSPIQKEYDRVYNRLKIRKQRGKISMDEWNAAVARAHAVLDLAECGELFDEKTRRRFETFRISPYSLFIAEQHLTACDWPLVQEVVKCRNTGVDLLQKVNRYLFDFLNILFRKIFRKQHIIVRLLRIAEKSFPHMTLLLLLHTLH